MGIDVGSQQKVSFLCGCHNKCQLLRSSEGHPSVLSPCCISTTGEGSPRAGLLGHANVFREAERDNSVK